MAPSTAVQGTALGAAVKLVVRTFLEEPHYQKLHRILSDRWSGHQSLAAAVKLMEQHGVKLSPDEEARIGAMQEDDMIDYLVRKMPKQSREQFEHFFLQLQLVVSTTQRLRQALDAGYAKSMEDVLDSADDVGVTPYIVKMAVVQAGAEVKQLEAKQDAWLTTSERKMGPLLRGQEDSMLAQMELANATQKLAELRGDSKDKSAKVLMGLASGKESALVATMYGLWVQVVRTQKVENEIRKDYEERIFFAENRLIDYKSKQLENVKGVLMRKAAQGDAALLALVIETFKADVEERKRDEAAADQVKDLEAKLSSYASAQAANTKKVMARMNAGTDAALLQMTFTAWIQFVEEYKKDKENEDMLKAAELKYKEFMEKQSAGAKSVLDKMANGNDSALLANTLKEWIAVFNEGKQAAALEAQLAAANDRFSSLTGRNKGTASGVMGRAAELQDMMLLMSIWQGWKMEAKLQRARRFGQARNEQRKQQIQGVKTLFKSFASELEQIKDDTPAKLQQ